jgi:hypothetical protein
MSSPLNFFIIKLMAQVNRQVQAQRDMIKLQKCSSSSKVQAASDKIKLSKGTANVKTINIKIRNGPSQPTAETELSLANKTSPCSITNADLSPTQSRAASFNFRFGKLFSKSPQAGRSSDGGNDLCLKRKTM